MDNRQIDIRTYVSLSIILALFIIVIFGFFHLRQGPGPNLYQYETFTSKEQIQLHIVKTAADNIEPISIATNVKDSGYMGINAGFFYEGNLLSVAIVNDDPANGSPADFGSGGSNVKYERGTFVFDKVAKKTSIQAVQSAADIQVMNRGHYWAVGGISMSLNDLRWKERAEKEALPAMYEARLRSGILYDEAANVYATVTPDRVTAEQFRQAIYEYMSIKNIIGDGIFLDGDGSAQLYVREQHIRGDERKVYAMLRLLQ
ncbi:hypothetical protein [Paenibacillus sp. OSY-SE]|uniref:hypothetical protein n=1 Tax=Paenibacillus sp. OSY-SE TaxID=1196323 RepID=UPI00030A0F5D|nr:hypothetical protein [Paenibacillus sp. OSY-SE]